MNFSALIFDHANLLIALCLAAVIFQYFRNNPLRHSRWASVLVVMASVGITSLMAGTAATEFWRA
jgi:hypothetical protein